jgi:hypothetical protein
MQEIIHSIISEVDKKLNLRGASQASRQEEVNLSSSYKIL